jgi:hypothetical protein
VIGAGYTLIFDVAVPAESAPRHVAGVLQPVNLQLVANSSIPSKDGL